jgi:hypothetical protein
MWRNFDEETRCGGSCPFDPESGLQTLSHPLTADRDNPGVSPHPSTDFPSSDGEKLPQGLDQDGQASKFHIWGI